MHRLLQVADMRHCSFTHCCMLADACAHHQALPPAAAAQPEALEVAAVGQPPALLPAV